MLMLHIYSFVIPLMVGYSQHYLCDDLLFSSSCLVVINNGNRGGTDIVWTFINGDRSLQSMLRPSAPMHTTIFMMLLLENNL